MSEQADKKANAIKRRFSTEVQEVLRHMQEDYQSSPEGMDYFYRAMHSRHLPASAMHQEQKPGPRADRHSKVPTIGTTCMQVPDELIIAMGARAIRMCSGSHTYDLVGTEQMPSRSCSLVRSTHGLMQSENYSSELDLMVIPTTCDQKKKAGEMMEDSGYTVHFLDLPSRRDTDSARAYWVESVGELTAKLEKVTGNRIKASKLKEASGKVSRARQEFRRLHSLRKHSPALILGKDVFMITGTYSTERIEEWTDSLAKLNDRLEANLKNEHFVAKQDAPRLLITGAPPLFPNLKVPLLAEHLGGVIVADEVCTSTRLLYDTVSFEEPNLYDMIPAVADRYLKPCTCPYLVPNKDRQNRLLDMVRSFDVDGVIYQAFSGCQLYEMEQRLVGKAMAENGINMLYIETDYSQEDMGQLSTRMEAFLESIRIRKRNRKQQSKNNKES